MKELRVHDNACIHCISYSEIQKESHNKQKTVKKLNFYTCGTEMHIILLQHKQSSFKHIIVRNDFFSSP